jgi:hypothetical protein
LRGKDLGSLVKLVGELDLGARQAVNSTSLCGDVNLSATSQLPPSHAHWIVSAEDLPRLSIPKHAVVTKDFIEFDGWVFPLSYVTKSLLVWLQRSFLRWIKEDDSKENKEWVDGLVEAFQDALAGDL